MLARTTHNYRRPLARRPFNLSAFDALNHFFNDDFFAPTPRRARPSAVRETFEESDESLVLSLDVPGFGDGDIEISLLEERLTVRGDTATETTDETEGEESVEATARAERRFERSYRLATPVDPERSSASLENGVLTITLAKAEAAQPRLIPIG